jgi:hypothetical protein
MITCQQNVARDTYLRSVVDFNPLKTSGYFICHQVLNSETSRSARRVHLCALYVSHYEDRLRLISHSVFTD